MSCPTVESKPLPSAVSVPKELTINGSAGKMSYPYKKRVRDAFERHQQQEQQQQQDPQRRLQPQQQYAQHHRQQGKKQPKHMLQLEASGTAIAASGNIPEEAGASGISRGEAPNAELPARHSRDVTSDVDDDDDAGGSSSNFSDSSGGDNLSELDEAALEARLCCCLAVRVGENTVRACGRPAFGIWFSNKLREKALKKRLPFVYNRGRGHWYTCLFHYRIIMHESKLRHNETLESRDLSKYLAVEVTEEEYRALKDDPLTKSYVKDHEQIVAAREIQKKKKKKKGRAIAGGDDAESSEDEQPILNVLAGLWPFPSSNFHTIREDEIINPSASGEGLSTFTPPQVPFQSLSATTLRRYKKYFNLPHRSSTNTKQQLLEGISEHFGTVDASAYETAAHFVHMTKAHKNKLDYPAGDL